MYKYTKNLTNSFALAATEEALKDASKLDKYLVFMSYRLVTGECRGS